MAFSPITISFLSILLLLHPTTTLSNFLAPFLAPLFDQVCKEVVCGKGKCVPTQNGTFSYECECDPGWKQAHADHDDHHKFLPCVIPNCTLNYACAAAVPSPVPIQDKETKTNTSPSFDPCHWADCGVGKCNKTSTFTYSCICAEGFFNLLNVSTFPCFKECSIGLDCASIGISTSNVSTPSLAPALADYSRAGSKIVGEYLFLIILVISLVMVNLFKD